MASLEHEYESAFVLDRSKLMRIRNVIREKLKHGNTGQEEPSEIFEVRLANNVDARFSSVDEVLALDNSRRKAIQRLQASFSLLGRKISVQFGERKRISVNVTCDDRMWCMDALSTCEEQIERTFQTRILHRIGEIIGATTALTIGVVIFAAIFIAPIVPTQTDRTLDENMWLTEPDVAELRTKLDESEGDELVASIVRRQVANLDKAQRVAQSQYERSTRRLPMILLVYIPGAIIIGLLIYMAKTCYPAVVFLWGDAEEWYANLVSRRRVIWSGVVLAMLVGFIGNMLYTGLFGLLQGVD